MFEMRGTKRCARHVRNRVRRSSGLEDSRRAATPSTSTYYAIRSALHIHELYSNRTYRLVISQISKKGEFQQELTKLVQRFRDKVRPWNVGEH